MTEMRISFGLFLLLLFPSGLVFAQQRLKASEAKDHVGQAATVCGRVESAHFAASSKRQPTFINLDAPYPQQIFTIVIWGNDRSKFGKPEIRFNHKQVCASGTISEYRGVPEIVATDPSQIRVEGSN